MPNIPLEDFIRTIPDFPKEGVAFKDITLLLANAEAMNAALNQLYDFSKNLNADKIVGIDSRGFIFAPMLAHQLGVGFVPVRKMGKLPYQTHKAYYNLEYGMDCLEIHQDGIKPGERVIVHDDVLATGGTAKAAIELIEKCGGEVVQLNFLIHLSFLAGKKLCAPHEVKSLITY